MSNLHLLLREIRFRRFNFFLSVLAVMAAGTLLVAGPSIVDSYQRDTNARIQEQLTQTDARVEEISEELDAQIAQFQAKTDEELAEFDKETTRTMRDLGFNLRILHKDTNLSDFYGNFHAVPMPEDYVHRLADETSITTIVHLVATLWEKTKWNERTVLVVGILPEVQQSHVEKKAPMGYEIAPGTCLLGHEVGIGLEAGETIELRGHTFTVARILPEMGSQEDISIMLELHDAQQVLEMPDQITQILALGCKCQGDRISVIREQLAAAMPEVQIHEDAHRAEAREHQRELTAQQRQLQLENLENMRIETIAMAEAKGKEAIDSLEESRGQMQRSMTVLVGVTTPLLVVVAAALVGLLAWLNVRERLGEIGLLRAVGRQTGSIAGMFLGKAVLLGVLGGGLACGLGYLLAWQTGRFMEIPNDVFQVPPVLIVATILGAPLIAAMASYVPMLHAVRQDPATVLLEH